MSIPVKLRISTRHILPTNSHISLYDKFRTDTLREIDAVQDDIIERPDPDGLPFVKNRPGSMTVTYPEVSDDDPNAPVAIIEKDSISLDDTDSKEFLQFMDELFHQFVANHIDNSNRYIFTTEAEMEFTPEQITLTYEEADDSTLGNTHNIIRYDPANPHALSIQRSGELMNTLVCEKGRRHTSVYTSPMLPMALEACTFTRRCDVNLNEQGGVVFLDYLIEIRGADVQRTTIRMDVTAMG